MTFGGHIVYFRPYDFLPAKIHFRPLGKRFHKDSL